jgi:hypothetical protein
VQVGVVNLDAGRRGDVSSGHGTRTLLAQVHDHRLVVLAGDDEALDVEDEVGDVFLDAGDGGELVQHVGDADGRDGRARDAREQGAAQRVAERVAEAGLERADGELLAVALLLTDGLDRGALDDEHAYLDHFPGAGGVGVTSSRARR